MDQNQARKKGKHLSSSSLPALGRGFANTISGIRNRIARRSTEDLHYSQAATVEINHASESSQTMESTYPPVEVAYHAVDNAIQMGNFPKPSSVDDLLEPTTGDIRNEKYAGETVQRITEAPLAHNIHIHPEGFEDKQSTYVGLIVVGCGMACFAIGAMGASIAWASILLACGVWTTMHKLRIDKEAIDHQIERHRALKDRVTKQGETAEWLNHIIEQMWGGLDPMQMTSLVDVLEDTLTQAMPKIQSTHVQDMELGTQAPRITSINVFPPTIHDPTDEVYGKIAFDLHAYPSSAGSSMAPPHLLLHLYMGSGALPLPVKVQLLKFSGRAQFRIQTTPDGSFFKSMHLSFTWLPDFDIAVSPLGLLDLMSLPMLSHYIKDSINSGLQRFVEPRSLQVDLETTLNQPHSINTISVLQIHFKGAASLGQGTNANVTCSIEHGKVFGATRTIASETPEWDDTMFVPIPRVALENDLDLLVQVWDSSFDRSRQLGEVRFRLREIIEVNATTVFDGDVVLGHEEQGFNGTLSMTMKHYPIFDQPFQTETCPAMLGCFTYQGVGIGLSCSEASPYVVLYVDHKSELMTRIKFNNPAPHWNAASEHFVRDWRAATVTVVVKTRVPNEQDPVVGVATVEIGSVFLNWDGQSPLEHSQWYPLQGGAGFGQVRFGFVIKPLKMQLPPQLTGSSVGTLVMDSLNVTSSTPFTTKEPYYIHAQIENSGSLYQATQQTLNNSHGMEFEFDQLSFPIEAKYENTLILTLKQPTGDKAFKTCQLRLRDLHDAKVQTVTLDLDERIIPNSLHLRVVPLSGINDNKLTVTFRIGFFPGFSYAHHRYFAAHLPNLDPKSIITKSNQAWSIPNDLVTSPTSFSHRPSILDDAPSESNLPKLSKTTTLRNLIQRKITNRNKPYLKINI